MKVKELIEKLNSFDPDIDIILQKDAEGNGYSPLEGVDGTVIYKPDSTYSGEVYSKDWTYDEACFENEKDWIDFKESTPDCVVLYPVN